MELTVLQWVWEPEADTAPPLPCSLPCWTVLLFICLCQNFNHSASLSVLPWIMEGCPPNTWPLPAWGRSVYDHPRETLTGSGPLILPHGRRSVVAIFGWGASAFSPISLAQLCALLPQLIVFSKELQCTGGGRLTKLGLHLLSLLTYNGVWSFFEDADILRSVILLYVTLIKFIGSLS